MKTAIKDILIWFKRQLYATDALLAATNPAAAAALANPSVLGYQVGFCVYTIFRFWLYVKSNNIYLIIGLLFMEI